jgi:ABC-2 type transport system ATP-binding protein
VTTTAAEPVEPADPTESSLAGATASVSAAVETMSLSKRYGSLLAVNDLNLVVPLGSIFGLIGPNGAGKSTTFSMISTLLKPTSGDLRVLGIDPVTNARELRRRLGYMPDVLGVYDNLRVDEYLSFFASCYHVPHRKWPSLIEGLLELVDLDVKRSAMVNSLSRGMKQRLSLARALVHDPELLVLDEPASGLDPRARVELRHLLLQLRDMGKTIIVSSHILAELQEICTEVAILEAGQLLAAGTPDTIVTNLGGVRTVRVVFADGTTESFPVEDDAAQAALLRRLVVDDERDVVEFVTDKVGLEELFMSITKGIVQ